MKTAWPKPHLCIGPFEGHICPFKAMIHNAGRKRCVFCNGVKASFKERLKRLYLRLQRERFGVEGLTKRPRAVHIVKTAKEPKGNP